MLHFKDIVLFQEYLHVLAVCCWHIDEFLIFLTLISSNQDEVWVIWIQTMLRNFTISDELVLTELWYVDGLHAVVFNERALLVWQDILIVDRYVFLTWRMLERVCHSHTYPSLAIINGDMVSWWKWFSRIFFDRVQRTFQTL